MKNTRREFLRLSGLAGLGLANIGLLGAATTIESSAEESARIRKTKKQKFNMSGFSAPKLETVRIGFIGLGNRGPHAVNRMSNIEGVQITGICDLRPERTDLVSKNLENTIHKPAVYSGSPDGWKEMCNRDDIDLIYIATPWSLHAPMAIYAMEHGKHAAVEVPSAVNLDECWQMVETSERTRKHCQILENCCYDFFELLTLNMARLGFFGEIVHGEGAYIHDLLDLNFSKKQYSQMWRLEENSKRNGNLYPTHGLGPICQVMDINRGDKMEYLVSMSSNDFTMNNRAKELAASDEFFKPFVDRPYRGNMNTTTIKTNKGRTIMIQHDVSSTRPYSRIHLVSGTKGAASKYPEPARIAINHNNWVSPEEYKALEEKYNPDIVKKMGEIAKKIGGHGGMDFIMDWRLITNLRNGFPVDMDVYDAALWSAIFPLSEISTANRSKSIDVPDFTGGSWKTNKPVDLSVK